MKFIELSVYKKAANAFSYEQNLYRKVTGCSRVDHASCAAQSRRGTQQECHMDICMLKCTGKNTNDPSLVQHKLKYSHQLDANLDQAHPITVKPVRHLVGAYRVNLISIKKTFGERNRLDFPITFLDTFYTKLFLAI